MRSKSIAALPALLSLIACSEQATEPPAAATEPPATASQAAPARAPRATATEILGPFTGIGATLHPDNVTPHPVDYYGTDLGFSYVHGGRLQRDGRRLLRSFRHRLHGRHQPVYDRHL